VQETISTQTKDGGSGSLCARQTPPPQLPQAGSAGGPRQGGYNVVLVVVDVLVGQGASAVALTTFHFAPVSLASLPPAAPPSATQ
jgi:hypothetical protein